MKNKGCLIGGGLLAVIVIIGLWFMSIYNGLVPMQEDVKAQWSNVESAYQKRADLVPNLVNTVKGAANFEKETLTGVIEARAKATSTQLNLKDASELTPENLSKFQAAQDQLSSALSRLMVSVERYPELTATKGFQDLQVNLNSIEDEIKFERRKYNEAAKGYNSKIKKVPTSIVASIGGFKEKGYFEAAAGSENAPKVEF
ncbi:LemA family protein [Empedobacter brevis]|uniref:LemA family protein n=1 Tax=Empedobacter brevis TaxID=247 RepID=A0AAJ1V842_9FLAO|nr:LemA family protein [Empedobacter brevis]MDM1072742.1 LemA family protein [Empedobacter brevis]QHC84516.1 LemA family protein [Empedobacter brevis]